MMRFFLLARQRSSSAVRLVSDTAFPSREEALDVLAREAASGDFSADDLFVVDLETVTPVVLLGAPAPAMGEDAIEGEAAGEEATEEPIADAWETPEEETPEAEEEPAEKQPEVPADQITAGEAAWETAMAEELYASRQAPVEEPATEPGQEAVRAPQEEPWEDRAPLQEPEAEPAEAQAEEPAEREAEETPADEEEPQAEEAVAEEAAPDEAAAEESQVEEAAVEVPQVEEAAVEVPQVEGPAVDEPQAEGSVEEDLASALRRAASSMEESGVVAPPNVEEYAAAVVIEETELLQSDAPAPDAGTQGDESADKWPWEAEGTPVSDVEASDGALVEQSTDELLAALQAAVGPEPAAPVEFGAPAPPAFDPEPAAPGVPPSIEDVAEQGYGPVTEDALKDYLIDKPEPEPSPYVPVGIEEAGMEEISLLTPAEPASLTISIEETEVVEAPAADVVVQAAGEGGIESYTCDDCIYVVTCPKNHQDSPATCGAFQWKPV